jgi:hypothetical protein
VRNEQGITLNVKGDEVMENIANIVHIGELIAVSKVFELNPFQMISLIEDGLLEVFETKEDFLAKYGIKESYEELEDWCELNNGKVFTKPKVCSEYNNSH